MAKLSMHESLPFDEATAPSLVSTGELPKTEQVRDAVTEAYERYRSNGDGAVACNWRDSRVCSVCRRLPRVKDQ